MKKITLTASVVCIAAAPLVFLSAVYNRLPQTVPMHFGLDMKPDRWGDKSELWIVTAVVALISLGVYFLFQNLHRIDPKRLGQQPAQAFQKLGGGLLVFLSLLNFFLIGIVRGSLNPTTFLFPLLGLLFAFTGNYLYNIKPNYFAGFRLPWTLSDDDNWRKTHHLGGQLWFGGGLLIALVCPFLSSLAATIFFATAMLVMIGVPLVYSFRLFKHKQKIV